MTDVRLAGLVTRSGFISPNHDVRGDIRIPQAEDRIAKEIQGLCQLGSLGLA